MTSNAHAVKEFTEGANDLPCPDKPMAMSKADTLFIIRMVMSELDELACTVTKDRTECDQFMQEALDDRDKCKNFEYEAGPNLIAAQFDALVDSWYYSLNCAARHGTNLSSIFDLVHTANMNKRDPASGKFLRRESDNKIIKPKGWTSPDIDKEIERQLQDGPW